MKTTEIRIDNDTRTRLMNHLWASKPREEGAFLLIGHARDADGNDKLTVRDLVLPEPGDWEGQGAHWLTPTTSYINYAVMMAERHGTGLAFVHTHPDPRHPAELSDVDVEGTAKLWENLEQLLPGMPLASIVFTPKSFAGIYRAGSREGKLTHLVSVGGRITREEASDYDAPKVKGGLDAAHARQVLALGEAGQERLGRLRVAIVGLGGTGSPLTEQLARLGVRDFILIDPDAVEPSNISRIFGSTPEDTGKPKVEVAKRNLTRISPKARARAVHGDVKDHVGLLGTADIVFGCTDTHTSRHMLNDLAYSHVLPVLDLGCKIDTKEGSVRAVLGRVRYLRPGMPCLWCTGSIDGRVILEESMTEEERRARAADGYGTGLGPQPMVVHLTNLVASLAVHELLVLFAHLGEPHDGTEVFVDLLGSMMMRAESRTDPACRCSKVRGLGTLPAHRPPAGARENDRAERSTA